MISVRIKLAILISLLWALPLLFPSGAGQPLQPPSWPHPLGTDEFGRDTLATLEIASGYSVANALFMTTGVAAVSCVIVFLVSLSGKVVASRAFHLILSIVESCPLILWIFVLISVLSAAPQVYVLYSAFTLAVVPIFASVLYAEIRRVSDLDFVQAARCCGINEWRIFVSYIMPECSPPLVPLVVNTIGAAIALDGAIGLIGMGNRESLDLGIMIIRAKEQAFFNPLFAWSVLVMLIIVYYGISLLRQCLAPDARDGVPSRRGYNI